MNVFDSQREPTCTVQNQKTTRWKRPEALRSRYTVDSLCFCNNTFIFVSPGFCSVPFCWFLHCGATVPTDSPPMSFWGYFWTDLSSSAFTRVGLPNKRPLCTKRSTTIGLLLPFYLPIMFLWPKYCGSKLTPLSSWPGPNQFSTVTLSVTLAHTMKPHIDECTLWNISTVQQLGCVFGFVFRCTGSISSWQRTVLMATCVHEFHRERKYWTSRNRCCPAQDIFSQNSFCRPANKMVTRRNVNKEPQTSIAG